MLGFDQIGDYKAGEGNWPVNGPILNFAMPIWTGLFPTLKDLWGHMAHRHISCSNIKWAMGQMKLVISNGPCLPQVRKKLMMQSLFWFYDFIFIFMYRDT